MKHVATIASDGFTIIELLIATAVFSTVLVVITSGVILFTNNFYRGITQANTQSVARNVTNTIGQALQFGGAAYPYQPLVSPLAPTVKAFCINGVRYSYVLGRQVEQAPDSSGRQTRDALVVQDFGGVAACVDTTTNPIHDITTGLPSGAKELLDNNMWLSNLTIQQSQGNSYGVDIQIANGDADLLCNPGLSVNTYCDSNTTMPAGDYTADVQCKNHAGSQFCAVSALNMIVQQRL